MGWRGGGRGGRESFFRGLRVRLMSKLSVLLLIIGVSKQKSLFSSMSAECFFYGLHDSLCNMLSSAHE